MTLELVGLIVLLVAGVVLVGLAGLAVAFYLFDRFF